VTVYLRNAAKSGGADARRLRRAAQRLLGALAQGDASISLSLVTDAEIRELNRIYRGKDAATDVLSFSLIEGDPGFSSSDGVERLLGDVVVSVERAAEQAAAYDASLDSEIERLLIHGTLHLLGHDHERPDERARMESEERRLAAVLGLPWPYSSGDGAP
jgi:probable rRNA maturation factor